MLKMSPNERLTERVMVLMTPIDRDRLEKKAGEGNVGPLLRKLALAWLENKD